MERSYKFRLYPSREQEALIQRTFGCCRYVYNHFLAERKQRYEETGKSPTRFQQDKELTTLKQELEWLREPDKCALQNAVKNLDFAYLNFFRRVKNGEKPGYPRFKSKRDCRKSYQTSGTIKVLDRAVQLPKLGKVKCRVSKKVVGRILSATVSQNPSGKYFVSLCCTDVEIDPLSSTGAVVGLDMGVRNLLTLNTGEKVPALRPRKKLEAQLAKAQRQLSRKTKGSKGYVKARIRVAKLHEKIANCRRDELQKLTTGLIRKYDVICMETLNASAVVRENQADPVTRKRKNLNKAQYDVAWGEFQRMLSYKALWYGKTVLQVPEDYPSTQLCSCCGEKTVLSISVRRWVCPYCGTSHDRDVNAAINILSEGLRLPA